MCGSLEPEGKENEKSCAASPASMSKFVPPAHNMKAEDAPVTVTVALTTPDTPVWGTHETRPAVARTVPMSSNAMPGSDTSPFSNSVESSKQVTLGAGVPSCAPNEYVWFSPTLAVVEVYCTQASSEKEQKVSLWISVSF